MKGFHGIIFAYSASKALGALVNERTAASLIFCGRYRLIDFALSSMRNAGIHNCGVIMQRDYQSLLDHIGSGKPWDMSRKDGGLRMLPPFGLPGYHRGDYIGTMEALNAVYAYVRDIKEDNIVLLLGSVCVNIDLSAVIKCHLERNADITAICTDRELAGTHHRYVVGEDGFAKALRFDRTGGEGVCALEGYIIKKDVLMKMMDECKEKEQVRFHRDCLRNYLENGGRINTYTHTGYASIIRTVEDYYKASMDMLLKKNIYEIFPLDRPVHTKHMEGVSSYYGESSRAVNSLVADNCIIEGEIENCIISSGARIAKGARLKNCIVMQNCVVESGCELNYVIADKHVRFEKGAKNIGSPNLPNIISKNAVVKADK